MAKRAVKFKDVVDNLQANANQAPPGEAKKTFQAYANFLRKFPQEFGVDAEDGSSVTKAEAYAVIVPPKQWGGA